MLHALPAERGRERVAHGVLQLVVAQLNVQRVDVVGEVQAVDQRWGRDLMTVTDAEVGILFPVGHAERHVRIEKTRGAPERGVDVAPLVEEPGVVDAQRQADFDVIHFLALRVDFAVDVGRHLYRILVSGAVITVAGVEGQLQ